MGINVGPAPVSTRPTVIIYRGLPGAGESFQVRKVHAWEIAPYVLAATAYGFSHEIRTVHPRTGKPSPLNDVSPYQENAIRHLEDG